MTTSQPVHPELREVGKRPFGIYAIIFLFLLFILAAGLDIMRLRRGLPTALLAEIAEQLSEGSLVLGLPRLFIRDTNILVLVNVAIIVVLAFTAIGLWFRQRPAWVSAMVVIGIGLVYNIWTYLEGTPLYVNMLVNVLAVFYLNERGVRAYFEQPTAGREAPL